MTGYTQLTSTDIGTEQRRAFVMQEYLKGREAQNVYADWCLLYPGLSKNSYDKDVTAIYKALEARGNKDIDKVIDKHLLYLQDIYRECRENQDRGNALKTLKEIRETLGIGGTKTKNISVSQTTINNTQLPTLSLDEIRKLLGKSTGTNTIDITPDTE